MDLVVFLLVVAALVGVEGDGVTLAYLSRQHSLRELIFDGGLDQPA